MKCVPDIVSARPAIDDDVVPNDPSSLSASRTVVPSGWMRSMKLSTLALAENWVIVAM